MKHILLTALFIVITVPMALLPRGLAIRLGRAIGVAAYILWKPRRRIAIENLKAAMSRGAIETDRRPEDIIRENFRLMGRSLAELVKVYYGFGGRIFDSVRVEGLEYYEAARARGKGVILVGGHCSNWELMTLCVSSKIGPFHGVARRQSNPYINHFIIKAREKFGSGVIYKEGALKKFISILKQGGTVGVLMDQSVIPEEGVLVDFLGAPAWTTKMPALISRKTGAAVIPGFMHRTSDGYVIRLHPEVMFSGDEKADTQLLTSYVEDYVRENPTDWLWVHRRWKRT